MLRAHPLKAKRLHLFCSVKERSEQLATATPTSPCLISPVASSAQIASSRSVKKEICNYSLLASGLRATNGGGEKGERREAARERRGGQRNKKARQTVRVLDREDGANHGRGAGVDEKHDQEPSRLRRGSAQPSSSLLVALAGRAKTSQTEETRKSK